jgi:signal transduction histidine kinase
MTKTRWRQIRPILIGGGVSFAVVLAIAFASIPLQDLGDLMQFLLISSIPSLLLGYAIFVTGQFRLKHIQLKIFLAYGLGIAIAIANIYLTSRLMFLSEHDFFLLGLLLIFAALLSVSFGFSLAAGITESLNLLKQGTQRLAEGDLSVRVSVPYQDELAEVAEAFNIMAARLEAAFNRQRELEQARRDLIAAVSHDLRTPLASVRAMVEALSDKVVTDAETVSRYHQTIQGQITSLSLLIDDLFELSKLDSGRLSLKLEEAQINDLISDTLESMRAQAESKSVRLQGQVEPDLPPVHMESAKIQRVLYNLVQNAIRHTPADGAISINACKVDNVVQVDVTDTGEGIAEEDLAYIFDEFYRGEKSRNRSTGGAGLGLAIARGIVEAHGGRIWVESQPGAGAIFRFVLPHTAGR